MLEASSRLNLQNVLKNPKNGHLNDIIRAQDPMLWWLTEQGYYMELNQSALQAIGSTNHDEVVGHSHAKYFDKEFCSRLDTLREFVVESNRATEMSLERILPSSNLTLGPATPQPSWWAIKILPWYDDDPTHVAGLLQVATDLTVHVASVADSIESNYSQLMSDVSSYNLLGSPHQRTIPPEIEYTHDLDGQFITMNDFGMNSFGFTQSSLSSHSVLDIVAQRHHKHLARSIKNRFADVDPNRLIIWRTRDEHGNPLWLEIRASKVKDSLGEYVHGTGWRLSTSSLHALHRASRILTGGRVAAWDRDLDTDDFYVSEDWKRLLGIPSDRSVSYIEFLEWIHPHDRQRVRKEMSDHLSDLRPFYESRYRILHSDGEYRWMHATGKMSRALGGQRFVSGCNVDITQEMNDAQEMSEREELFRTIVDADPNLIFMKNSKRELVFINQALCNFYRTSHGQALYKNDEWFFRNHKRTDSLVKQLDIFKKYDTEVLESLGPGLVELVEYVVPPNCGEDEAKWFKTVKVRTILNGEPHIVGISADITALQREKEMFEALMELSPASTFVKNDEGRYIRVNATFVDFMGLKSVEQIHGKSAEDFFDETTFQAIRRTDEATKDGRHEDATASMVTLKSGEERTLFGTKRRVRVVGESGRLEDRIIGCDYDETSARSKAHLELLDSLLTSLKHDYVCRFLEIIGQDIFEIDSYDAFQKKRDVWDRMLRYSQSFIKRLQWLGATHLNGSAKETQNGIHIEEHSTQQIISDAIELASLLELFPECRLEGEANETLACDAMLASNVCFNLIHNAKRFTEGTNKRSQAIYIRVRKQTLSDGRPGVQIEVDDGGEGLPKQVAPRALFEKGVSYDPGDRSVKGTGIGLFFSKVIVEQLLHGEVLDPVPSTRGGAVFAIVLPQQRS